MTGFKTSGFKKSETSSLKNVSFTKSQLYKTSDCKLANYYTFCFKILSNLKTGRLENRRFET